MAVNRPEITSTTPHSQATDTAIAFLSRNPITAQPPENRPLYSGQLVAVQTSGDTCRLYVGSEDRSRWLAVVP